MGCGGVTQARKPLKSQAVGTPKLLRPIVFRDPPVERGAVHLEGAGGFGDVAVAGLEDTFAFDLGEGKEGRSVALVAWLYIARVRYCDGDGFEGEIVRG